MTMWRDITVDLFTCLQLFEIFGTRVLILGFITDLANTYGLKPIFGFLLLHFAILPIDFQSI